LLLINSSSFISSKNDLTLFDKVNRLVGFAGVLTTEISIKSTSVISLISLSHSILYSHFLGINQIENHFNIQSCIFLNTLSKSFVSSTVIFKPFQLILYSIVFQIGLSELCCNSITGFAIYHSIAFLNALGLTMSLYLSTSGVEAKPFILILHSLSSISFISA